MALLGLYGALAILGVVSIWLLAKAAGWQLKATQADSTEGLQIVEARVQEGLQLVRLVVLVIAGVEFWPGLAHWFNQVIQSVI